MFGERMEKCIYIIDDDQGYCNNLKFVLDQRGYYTEIFNNPNTLLQAIVDTSFDLIICDVKCGDMDSTNIVRQVKKHKPDTPVIILTANTDIRTAVSFMRMGVFDYLNRPLPEDELFSVVENAISSMELAHDRRLLEGEHFFYQKSLEERVQESTTALRKTLNELEMTHLETVKVLASAIEEKEPYLRGHSSRVSEYAMRIAKVYGLTPEEIKRLQFGALLHDIGKVAIPETILTKPDRLTDEEFEVIKSHPTIGNKIVTKVDFFQDLSPYIHYHHERYDGKGYPNGLHYDEMPSIPRMITVVDTYDAMSFDRPYRRAFSVEKCLSILNECKGTQFDPEFVDIFINHKLYDLID